MRSARDVDVEDLKRWSVFRLSLIIKPETVKYASELGVTVYRLYNEASVQ